MSFRRETQRKTRKTSGFFSFLRLLVKNTDKNRCLGFQERTSIHFPLIKASGAHAAVSRRQSTKQPGQVVKSLTRHTHAHLLTHTFTECSQAKHPGVGILLPDCGHHPVPGAPLTGARTEEPGAAGGDSAHTHTHTHTGLLVRAPRRERAGRSTFPKQALLRGWMRTSGAIFGGGLR